LEVISTVLLQRFDEVLQGSTGFYRVRFYRVRFYRVRFYRVRFYRVRFYRVRFCQVRVLPGSVLPGSVLTKFSRFYSTRPIPIAGRRTATYDCMRKEIVIVWNRF
jgi:hypothetical protein